MRQYNLLYPRRGIMMRLTQSYHTRALVPTPPPAPPAGPSKLNISIARLNYPLGYANFNGMQIRACMRVPSQLGGPVGGAGGGVGQCCRATQIQGRYQGPGNGLEGRQQLPPCPECRRHVGGTRR
jgi:hypothetical protein